MISVAEAFQFVTDNVSPCAVEEVPLKECLGRVLAKDVAAKISHPPVAVSSMDGYALRAVDADNAPFVLKQVGESPAGGGYDGVVGPGETVRIFTGAPLPAGADAVEMQENTEIDGDQITFQQNVPADKFIRPAGLDFAEGDVLIEAGTVLGARHVGLAAAMNLPSLPVSRKPRVAILATGNEVAMPGEDLGPSQIITSNSFALHAYITAMGGEPVDLGIAGDTMEDLRSKLSGAEDYDILVTIGGVSVGDYDLVGNVLEEKGLKQIFHKIAQRPGKPLLFGKIGDLCVFGMPGNPVSTGVCSMLYLKRAIMLMLGVNVDDEKMESAVLGEDLSENDQRQDYLRGRLEINDKGERVAWPFSKQDSSMQAKFAEADCLIVRAPHAPALKTGDRVDILPLRGVLISL